MSVAVYTHGMETARYALPKAAGLRAWKLCGSGTGKGFTPMPNTRVWAILAVWESEEIARARTAQADIYQRWRARAAEVWTVFLATTSTRGRWGGVEPFVADTAPGPGPLAALTRATIRPSVALRFRGRVPDISAAIGGDPRRYVASAPILTYSGVCENAKPALVELRPAFRASEVPHAMRLRRI